MPSPNPRVALTAMPLFALLACTAGKVETETDSGLPGTGTDDSAAPTSSPYEADARAGCSFDLAWDEGTDGTDQWWSTTTWDPRVDEDGDEYITGYTYETELADTLVESFSYDDLLCLLTEQSEETLEGRKTGSRATYTCDSSGLTTSSDVDIWADTDWADETTGTYTNTYDEAGHLIERVEVVEYVDEELPDTEMRRVYSYTGDLLTSMEYYLGADDDEELYYSIDYTYGGDDLVDTVRLVLGDYFGDSVSGTLYIVTEYTWDERGNVLTRDYENVYSGDRDEHEVWTWDEHDRMLSAEYWSDSDEVHWLSTMAWDEEFYRHTTVTYADMLDPTQDYSQTYTYDGGWPWSGTAFRDFVDESMIDGTFTFSNTCD